MIRPSLAMALASAHNAEHILDPRFLVVQGSFWTRNAGNFRDTAAVWHNLEVPERADACLRESRTSQLVAEVFLARAAELLTGGAA